MHLGHCPMKCSGQPPPARDQLSRQRSNILKRQRQSTRTVLNMARAEEGKRRHENVARRRRRGQRERVSHVLSDPIDPWRRMTHQTMMAVSQTFPPGEVVRTLLAGAICHTIGMHHAHRLNWRSPSRPPCQVTPPLSPFHASSPSANSNCASS